MPPLISRQAATPPATPPAKSSWLPSWLSGKPPAPASNVFSFSNPLSPKPAPVAPVAPAPVAPVAAARPYSLGDEDKIVQKLSDALEVKVGKTNLSFIYFQTLVPTIISQLKKDSPNFVYKFDEPFFTSPYEDGPHDGDIQYFILANILKWGVLFRSKPLYDIIYDNETIMEKDAPNLGQTYTTDEKGDRIILRKAPLDQSFIYSARNQQNDDAYDVRMFILKYFATPVKKGGYRRTRKTNKRNKTKKIKKTNKTKKTNRKTRNRRHQ